LPDKRHIPDPVRAHPLRPRLGEDRDKAFHSGKALHAFEFRAEHIGRIFKPDDQVGDVGFHHPLLSKHILDAGVLDIELRITQFGVGL
jgi:hypothetical protein